MGRLLKSALLIGGGYGIAKLVEKNKQQKNNEGQKAEKCASCGKIYGAGEKFCGGCGNQRSADDTAKVVTVCSSCGRVLNKEEKFCGGCGTEVNK